VPYLSPWYAEALQANSAASAFDMLLASQHLFERLLPAQWTCFWSLTLVLGPMQTRIDKQRTITRNNQTNNKTSHGTVKTLCKPGLLCLEVYHLCNILYHKIAVRAAISANLQVDCRQQKISLAATITAMMLYLSWCMRLHSSQAAGPAALQKKQYDTALDLLHLYLSHPYT